MQKERGWGRMGECAQTGTQAGELGELTAAVAAAGQRRSCTRGQLTSRRYHSRSGSSSSKRPPSFRPGFAGYSGEGRGVGQVPALVRAPLHDENES